MSQKKNQGGALIGVLVVIVIIAFLYLGSLFFGGGNQENNPQNQVDTLEEAEDVVDDANRKTEEKNEAIEGEDQRDTPEEEEKDLNTEVKIWRTLESEQIGISLNYPGNWYYNINHEEAGELGYDLIVGFASSSKIWEMDLPYPIELVVANSETEIKGNYTKELDSPDNKKYILRTERQEYKKIVDQITESFKLINN